MVANKGLLKKDYQSTCKCFLEDPVPHCSMEQSDKIKASDHVPLFHCFSFFSTASHFTLVWVNFLLSMLAPVILLGRASPSVVINFPSKNVNLCNTISRILLRFVFNNFILNKLEFQCFSFCHEHFTTFRHIALKRYFQLA